jgi:hypothetical protein
MDARVKSLVTMPQIAEALRGLPSLSVTGRLVGENIGNAAEVLSGEQLPRCAKHGVATQHDVKAEA